MGGYKSGIIMMSLFALIIKRVMIARSVYLRIQIQIIELILSLI